MALSETYRRCVLVASLAAYLSWIYGDFESVDIEIRSIFPNFHVSNLLWCMLWMSFVDILLRDFFKQDANATWYLIHALLNFSIVYRSYEDLFASLVDPLHAHEGFPISAEKDSMTLIMVLHIYHVIAFPCTTEDYIHHIVSVGVVGGIGCMVNWGRSLNACNFFMCGLPGGVDYVLLFLRKHSLIESLTEKRINSQLNLLLRWPGFVVVIYVTVLAYRVHNPAPLVGWLPILTVLFLHGANAAYYCQKVVGNYWVSEAQSRSPAPSGVRGSSKPHAAGQALHQGTKVAAGAGANGGEVEAE